MPDIIMAVGGLIGRVLVATQNMIEAGGFQVAMQRGWQPEGQQEQRDDGTKALHGVKHTVDRVRCQATRGSPSGPLQPG